MTRLQREGSIFWVVVLALLALGRMILHRN
jgi:hypothetical protein